MSVKVVFKAKSFFIKMKISCHYRTSTQLFYPRKTSCPLAVCIMKDRFNTST